jgi:cell division transport system permease protein
LKNQIGLSDLTRNPLPDTFEIYVEDPGAVLVVVKKVENLPGIEKVKHAELLTQRLISVNHAVRITGATIVLALIIATILIVSNTIRLTVFARRKEISIMQLVGAANWFIRWPFIIEGIVQALTGALLALGLVRLAYHLMIPQMEKSLPFLPVLPAAAVSETLALIVLGTGLFVGIAGSLISVNKFLDS